MNVGTLKETGRIISNNTDVVLVNNTAKTQRLTVPAGKRWFLYCGSVENADDVNRNAYVVIEDASNDVLVMLKSSTALVANQIDYFPCNDDLAQACIAAGCYPIPLEAGWHIRYEWGAGGASTGGTAKITAICVEVVV